MHRKETSFSSCRQLSVQQALNAHIPTLQKYYLTRIIAQGIISCPAQKQVIMPYHFITDLQISPQFLSQFFFRLNQSLTDIL